MTFRLVSALARGPWLTSGWGVLPVVEVVEPEPALLVVAVAPPVVVAFVFAFVPAPAPV